MAVTGHPLSEAFVRITADDRPLDLRVKESRAKLLDLAKQVTTARIDADDKLAQYKVAKMLDQLKRLDRVTASPNVTDRGIARAELALLGVEASLDRIDGRHVTAKVSVDTGAFAKLAGGLSGLATAPLPIFGNPVIAVAAIAALTAGLFLLAPAAIGAGVAIASFAGFAALAVPEITKLFAAVGGGKAALKDLSGPEKQVVSGLKDLKGKFGDLALAIKPEVVKAFGSAIQIVRDLFPAFEPLLKAAGKALDTLLSRMDNWLTSPAGKKFVNWLATTGPKDIQNFGNFLWSVVRIIGTVLVFLYRWGERIKTFFETDVPAALQIFINYVRLIFDKLVIFAEQAIVSILGAFSHIPLIGGQFARARDAAQKQLDGMVSDADKAQAAINEAFSKIHGKSVALVITGHGTWALSGGQRAVGTHPVSGIMGGAAGMFVTAGSGPTADDVLARVSKGELIVPANMVAAGAVDHLRGHLPGFAGGGIVPGYSDGVPGLARWAVSNAQATENQIIARIGNAIVRAFQHVMNSIGGAGVPGPGGGAPAANAALARQLYPKWGFGAEWTAWNALVMGESGWSNTITNAGRPYDPYTVAYGIPQALPAIKMGAAANPPASNPTAQINWMVNYIRTTPGYGDPIRTYQKWLSRSPHWYGSGTDSAAPGWAVVGERGPELVNMAGGEQVVPGFAKGGLVDKIHAGERVMRQHPALGRVFGRLLDELEGALGRVRGAQALVTYGNLHGDALSDARERLHRARKHEAELRREIRPLHHRRHIVKVMEHALAAQERGIALAITEAQARHMPRVADQLRDKASHYRGIDHWAGWWLNRQYWQPTHHQNVVDRRKTTRIIDSVLAGMGLPVQSFDKGGYLMPGATLALNGLGRPEPVGAQPVAIEMSWKPGSGPGGGMTELDRALHNWMVKHVDFHGGGDVQVTFGNKHY